MAKKSASRMKKAKRRGQKRAGKKMMSFDKRVQAVVSRSMEDKFTQTKVQLTAVATQDALQVVTWARFFASAVGDTSGVWSIAQGVGNGQRVGNKIKVKRWLIKGLIQPKNLFSAGTTLANTEIGYVTVYLGRLQAGDGLIAGTLPGLFQQGNTSITPVGAAFESLYATNTDKYKVYAKKTFKMGQAQNELSQSPFNNRANNDFSLTAKFTFDVTKYVFKNRHIMYDDTNVEPQNFDMSTLCVWAVFQPAVGVISGNPPAVEDTFYGIQFCSYGNYEDA